MLRRRREEDEDIMEESVIDTEEEIEVPDITSQPKTETDIQKEQLEKMARDNPEDFAKLIRSWLADD